MSKNLWSQSQNNEQSWKDKGQSEPHRKSPSNIVQISVCVCVCGGVKLNQRVYVNPLTRVPINSPVDHSPAKSRGTTLAVILECHSCPPELLFVRNAGEIQHVIRSGGAL